MSALLEIMPDMRLHGDMRDTPLRVARMYVNEFFRNEGRDEKELINEMTVFPNDNRGKDNIILVRNIPFSSLCRHHLLPFTGKVNIGYTPSESIFGLSKLPRIVKWFSQKPQIQEKLTKEITDFISLFITPVYVRVVIKAEHSCIGCRGVNVPCDTITTLFNSVYLDPERSAQLNGLFISMGGYQFD
jgi:GTP cyclohydrolase I